MKGSPFAGKPAESSMLVDVPKLITVYYTESPDPSVHGERVVFGELTREFGSLSTKQGYFRQVIDKNGAQQALFPYSDPGNYRSRLYATERRMAAAGAQFAGLLGLVACLAGPGRPGEAVPARQQ